MTSNSSRQSSTGWSTIRCHPVVELADPTDLQTGISAPAIWSAGVQMRSGCPEKSGPGGNMCMPTHAYPSECKARNMWPDGLVLRQ